MLFLPFKNVDILYSIVAQNEAPRRPTETNEGVTQNEAALYFLYLSLGVLVVSSSSLSGLFFAHL